VAVIALYPAQAELLRLLLARSPAVAAATLAVEVGTPAAFRHRDCLVALVSLTRSHSHRAVPLGDGPQALAEALTRAAGRLVLFGDPATLARRSQWQGALDHLDEHAARAERRLVGQLVESLEGQGPLTGAILVGAPGRTVPAGAVEGAGA
jgi:superfamily I DNA and/or RNA helicase